ncbi:MAG: winged helix-turn-helix transcriptional regulator, partial [Flavobacteriales bacterium]|nr:winged helix-turn-helix transcriptional regulator [Flavobacteriales bacterium]
MNTRKSKFKLDERDYKIIGLLKDDRGMSIVDMAKEIGISVNTVRYRYNKLMDSGILNILNSEENLVKKKNFNARINMDIRPSYLLDYVTSELTKVKEVSFVGVTSSQFPIEISIGCTDNEDLMKVLNEKIYTIEGVQEVNVTLYLDIRYRAKIASIKKDYILKKSAQEKPFFHVPAEDEKQYFKSSHLVMINDISQNLKFSKWVSLATLLIFVGALSLTTPVYSQCTNPQDFDGDGIIDSIDPDDDNDGILDVDEGLPLTGGTWGIVDATPSHDPLHVSRFGTVGTGDCAGAGDIVNYEITNEAGGGTNDGIILLSDQGYSCSNNANGQPQMQEDFVFEMMFDRPVDIRIASNTTVFGGDPYPFCGYWNETNDDILVTTDGCSYEVNNDDNSICGYDDRGDASLLVEYGCPDADANDQFWYVDLFNVTSVRIEMTPGNYTSQYAIGVNPVSVCEALDTDNDGTPDYQDLDSDADGCPDAIEGGGGFTYADVDGDGVLLGGVDADGVPIVAGSGGHSVGDSKDGNVLAPNCGPSCSLTPIHLTCFEDGTGELAMLINTAIAPYDIQWDGAMPDETSSATTYNEIGVLAGTYEVTVTDVNDEVFTCSTTIIEPEALLIDVTHTNETVCGNNDGTATVSWISGGTYNSVTSDVGFNGAGETIAKKDETDLIETVSGMYRTDMSATTLVDICVNFTDVGEDKIDKLEMSISDPCGNELDLKLKDGPKGNTGVLQVCYTTTAAAEMTMNGPFTGPADYLPSDGVRFDDPTNAIASGGCDPDGDWILWVKNGANKETIIADWSMTLKDSVPGVGPPNYVWSNASETDAAITGLTGSNSFETYTVTATDDNSCSATATVDIWCPTAPTCSIVVDVEPSCPGVCDGQATVTVGNLASGTVFSVAWDNSSNDVGTGLGFGGTHQSTANLCDLSATDYTVTVTDEGTPTLTGTCTVNLTDPSSVVIVYASDIEPLCNGGNDGSVTFTYSGGTADYTIETVTSGVVNNQSSGTYTASGLAAGLHGITITDNGGCPSTTEFDLGEPTPVSVTADGVAPLCFGSSDGNLTAVASGGTVAGAYGYVWGGVSSQQNNIGTVASGVYVVSATDDNGCTATDEFELFDPPLLVITIINPVNPTCNGAMDGTMESTVTGGTPGYTYLWSDLVETDHNISGLDEGVTGVVVTDSQGCIAVDDETLTDPLLVAATELTTPATCGAPNGTAWIDTSTVNQVSGGVAPYTYLWDNNAGNGTNSLATGLAVGNYFVTVYDANSCFLAVPVSISDPGAPQIVWNSSGMVSCNGGDDAFGEIEIVSGNRDFAISWSGGTPVGGTTALGTGMYSATGLSVLDSPLEVTITDTDGCEATQLLIITEPDEITVVTSPTNPSCYGADSFGSLLAVATGGTGDPTGFVYNWDNTLFGEDQSDVTVTGTDDYVITVTDDNGCTGTQTAQLVEPTEVDSEISGTDPLCFGSSDGTVDLTNPTGGTGSGYTYLWTPSGNDQGLTGLTSGTYDVIISDGNLCTITRTLDLIDPAELFANATVNTHANCDAICFNGEVKVIATGGVGLVPADYTYVWDNAATNDTLFNLNNNIYCATVTDANGCMANDCAEVLGYPAQVWVEILEHNPCYEDEVGSIDLSMTVRGNGPVYVFTWESSVSGPFAGDSVLTDLVAGTYSVTISDFLNQLFEANYVITQPAAPLAIQCSGINPLCFESTEGSVTVVATGGTSGYTYLWDDDNAQTTATASNLGAGIYNVIVTDANNCIQTCQHVLTHPDELIVTLRDNKPADCGIANGELTANAVGGTGDYTYRWLPTANDDVVSPTNLSNGTNTVTVTDENGCVATEQDDLEHPNSPEVTVTVIKHVSCFGGDDAKVVVGITGGQEPYNYDLTVDGTTTSDVL